MNNSLKFIASSLCIGTVLLGTNLFIQSCNNDLNDIPNISNSNRTLEYLDCPTEVTTETELKIIDEAFQRIGKNFIVEEDTCYLTISSVKELNISDKVFSLVKRTINSANRQYRLYVYFEKHEEYGIKLKNPFQLNLNYTTTRAYNEVYVGPQFTMTSITLSHNEVNTVINEMRTCIDEISLFIHFSNLGFDNDTISHLVDLYFILTDEQLSSIQEDYAKSGSTNGITLIETTTWSATTGISSTTYRYTLN